MGGFLRMMMLWVGLSAAAAVCAAPAAPRVIAEPTGFAPEQLGLIVNLEDPLSVGVANYYQSLRGIPEENVLHVRFPPDETTVDPAVFEAAYAELVSATPTHVQAYALTWAAPYRVGCMSITAAFAFGYDTRHCASGCQYIASSPYYDSDSTRPFDEFGIRPTMTIAGAHPLHVRDLIARGAQTDGTLPPGTAYLLNTSDASRNVRAAEYDSIESAVRHMIAVEIVNADALSGRDDVMFYFTGVARVADLDSNRFLPGSVGDHLTSTGGQLTDSRQMSVLAWIEAGVSGTYGTVVEPCNIPQKFPHPGVLIAHYTAGESLIEAYWKSVQMPGQGIFVGDPLANPWRGHKVYSNAGRWYLQSHTLEPGFYVVESANTESGGFSREALRLHRVHGAMEVDLGTEPAAIYRIRRLR